MKYNNLIKVTPFLSTILLIIFLSITNQKVNTKLRILIWDTPSLSLGTYIAISSGTGFILFYLITNNLSKLFKTNSDKSLKFRDQSISEEINEYKDQVGNTYYDHTLIERDLKDPSPTINASFRIIGKEKSKKNIINNNIQYEDSIHFEEQYERQPEINETRNQVDSISADWNDESYSSW
tara:strand:- start:1295 stop:1834 length:540 start_codon:yes stop_codon:yes gene_type:complete